MKRQYLASTLSIVAMMASSAWISADAVTFIPPTNNGTPSQSTGGASRGSFFVPVPGKGVPSQATGGASRGSVFVPPSDNGTPGQSTGGASRGSVFAPPSDNGTPGQATGGASRGSVFAPPSDNGTPQQTIGGASRGSVFAPPSDNGTPGQASGGASRVGTYYLNPSTVGVQGPAALIALLPSNFYGTTLSEHPTILVYVPASNAKEATFSLKDEAGKMQYHMTIPIAGKIGTIAIKLPADAPALALGKNYQWFLAIELNGKLSPSTPYVDGWIQRIQPSAELAKAMQQEDAMKQAAALGANGVWYDCVATLAALHIAEPTNATIAKQWEELLESVSLKQIAAAPLVVSSN